MLCVLYCIIFHFGVLAKAFKMLMYSMITQNKAVPALVFSHSYNHIDNMWTLKSGLLCKGTCKVCVRACVCVCMCVHACVCV